MMNLRSITLMLLTAALVIAGPGLLQAQQRPEFEMKHHVDTTSGKIFWNRSVPFVVKLVSYYSDDEVTLSDDNEELIYFDSEGLNTIRSPWLVDPETKTPVYPQTDVIFKVYADGMTPVTSSSFSLSPVHKDDHDIYYGQNLLVDLKTSDQMSGVKELYYSINQRPYQPFTEPLGFSEEGDHQLKYFAVDHVGNAEEESVLEFTVDTNPPETFHSVTDIDVEKSIISTSSKITLDLEDNIAGVSKTFYSMDGGEKRLYKGGVIPVEHLEDGEHTLTYFSVDHVENTEEQKEFGFYMDRTAPITSSDVLGDRFVFEDKIYFSGRTKLKLTAVDNKSGVKEIRYSIDGGTYQPYTEPFYLPSVEGMHEIRFFAVDNISNTTGGEDGEITPEQFKHSVIREVFTDLVGPSVNHRFTGRFFPTRDTVFVCNETRINLSASDGESGLQYISYSIDDNREEIRYEEPFTIEKGGLHEIEFFAYDNVNNRNRSTFFCFLDDEPPAIYHTFSIPPLKGSQPDLPEGVDVYPSYVTVFLAAVDEVVGAEKIHYSVNGGQERRYDNPVEGFKVQEVNSLKIIAFDKLGNREEQEIQFYITD
ncbi:MAG: hypothetical protein ABFS10_06935 [Bacteroidota bacterium]